MLQLIKYEIRRQLFSKVLFFLLLVIMEMLFLFGIYAHNEDIFRSTNRILTLIAFFGMCYIALEPATVYSNDLGRKQGYLLFMTPNSSMRIIGAKIITGAGQIMLFFCIIIGMIKVNDQLLSSFYGYGISQLDCIFNIYGDAGFSLKEFMVTALFVLFMCVDFLTLAFLSISLSCSYLAKGKMNTLISIVIFITLLLIETVVIGITVIQPYNNAASVSVNFILISMLLFVIPAAINLFGTVRLLDRKVSI